MLQSGDLSLQPDNFSRAPTEFVNRVATIHNFDEIRCTPEQMGAIQSVLGINDGELLDSTRPEHGRDVTVEEGIRNVGYLAL